MTGWGDDYQAIVDKLQAMAAAVTPPGLTVKGSATTEEGNRPGGFTDFPYVVIISQKSPVDRIGINEDRFRLAFKILYVTQSDDISQGFKDLIKLGGALYDAIAADPKLSGKASYAHVNEWDAGFAPTEKNYTRMYLKVSVMVLAHR